MSDFPWFKSYPSEVPKTIELNSYNNLVEIFDQSVKNFGDKIAYKNMDVEMSFNEVSEIGGVASKSLFRGLPEVEMHRKIPLWKAESQGFPSVEESASEDITIKSYGDFEL